MKNSYQFFATTRPTFTIMLALFGLVAMLLPVGILITILIHFAKSINESMVGLLIIGTIILALVLFFIAYKLSVKFAGEQWTISFNSEQIEISSDKRAKIITPFSQLTMIDLFREKVGLSHKMGHD